MNEQEKEVQRLINVEKYTEEAARTKVYGTAPQNKQQPQNTLPHGKKSPWYFRWYMIAVYAFVGFVILMFILTTGMPTLVLPDSTSDEFLKIEGKYATENADIKLYVNGYLSI